MYPPHVPWCTLLVYQCAFLMYQCAFLMYKCAFLMYQCAFLMYQCTFLMYQCTFLMYQCAFLMSSVLYQVTLVEEGVYLCLDVPGLAKRKEEVTVGDKLIFSNPGEWQRQSRWGCWFYEWCCNGWKCVNVVLIKLYIWWYLLTPEIIYLHCLPQIILLHGIWQLAKQCHDYHGYCIIHRTFAAWAYPWISIYLRCFRGKSGS